MRRLPRLKLIAAFLVESERATRRYYCQPDLALSQRAKELGLNGAGDLPDSEADSVAERVRPQFTSLRYGEPEYCQLSMRCASEIRQGAHDESEMGAFHDLFA